MNAARAGDDPPVDGATVREEKTNVGGQPTRYLTAGEGPPLVLLHALDWSRVLPRGGTENPENTTRQEER